MVDRKTAAAPSLVTLPLVALSLAALLSTSTVTASSDNEGDVISIQSQSDLNALVLDSLKGKTVQLSGAISQPSPTQQLPMKSYQSNGEFLPYNTYTFEPTAGDTNLPILVLYSKTERDDGPATVTGIINEVNVQQGIKGSGLFYLRETDD